MWILWVDNYVCYNFEWDLQRKYFLKGVFSWGKVIYWVGNWQVAYKDLHGWTSYSPG